jgi:hypothetical protein
MRGTARFKPARVRGAFSLFAGAGALLLGVVACDGVPGRGEGPGSPPRAAQVASHYQYSGELTVEMTGNVARVTVSVDPTPFERGGDLWAKAFPYVFLFSQATRDVFDRYPGLGGVRVVARHPNGQVISEALLPRGEMNAYGWRQGLNIAALARLEGTERPGRMRDLVRWGEDHTEFVYNPRFISVP